MESIVLKAHIPRYRQLLGDRKKAPVIIYETELSAGSIVWTIDKRYSEFRELYLKLKDRLHAQHAFPPKTIVNNKKPKFLDHRRRDLEAWLASILAIPRVLANHEALVHFVALPSSVLATISAGDAQSGPPPSWIDLGLAATNDDCTKQQQLQSFPPPLWQVSVGQTTIDAIYGRNAHVEAIAQQSAAELARHGLTAPTAAHPLACVAKAKFRSAFDRDLPFDKGDIISIVGQDQTCGWWVGEVSGTRGLVPLTFVDVSPDAVAAATPVRPVMPTTPTGLGSSSS
eukprot:m.26022 g.26022  ORF g.26022 m.26022 type:complete len:285 (+) comp4233_c0_seq2:45-899(+)